MQVSDDYSSFSVLLNKCEQEANMMQGKGAGKTLAGKEQSHLSPARYYNSENLGWLMPCTVSDLPFLWSRVGKIWRATLPSRFSYMLLSSPGGRDGALQT